MTTAFAITFPPFARVGGAVSHGGLSLPNRKTSKLRDGGVGSAVCLNRLLFERTEVGDGGLVNLPASDMRAAHVRDVLRIPEGETGRLRAGILGTDDADCGQIFDQVSTTVSADGCVELSLLNDSVEKQVGPAPNLTLVLAMPRPKVLARLLPQIAAVGVSHIALVNAYKVERCYFDSFLVRREHELRSALVTGLMQAGNDTRVPTVSVSKRLRVFLEDDLREIAPSDSTTRIVAHPSKTGDDDVSVLERLACANRNGVCLAVGPEGGWMDREISMLVREGFETASLGSRVLRTDAAVLILMGIVHEYVRTQGRNKVL